MKKNARNKNIFGNKEKFLWFGRKNSSEPRFRNRTQRGERFMILADTNVIIKIIQAGCLIDFFRG